MNQISIAQCTTLLCITEIYTHVHNSFSKWRIVGFGADTLWAVCDSVIRSLSTSRHVVEPPHNKFQYNPISAMMGLVSGTKQPSTDKIILKEELQNAFPSIWGKNTML